MSQFLQIQLSQKTISKALAKRLAIFCLSLVNIYGKYLYIYTYIYIYIYIYLTYMYIYIYIHTYTYVIMNAVPFSDCHNGLVQHMHLGLGHINT